MDLICPRCHRRHSSWAQERLARCACGEPLRHPDAKPAVTRSALRASPPAAATGAAGAKTPPVAGENSSLFSLDSLKAIAQEAMERETARAAEPASPDVIDLKRRQPSEERLTPTPMSPVVVPVLPLGLQPVAPEAAPSAPMPARTRASLVGPVVAGALVSAALIAGAIIVSSRQSSSGEGTPASTPRILVKERTRPDATEGQIPDRPEPPPVASERPPANTAAPTPSTRPPQRRPPVTRRPAPPPGTTATAPQPRPAGACAHCAAGDLGCFISCKAG